MGEHVGAHFIGNVQVGFGHGAITKDPIVIMTLWAHDIAKPGEFAMEPRQARLLATALNEMADKAEAQGA